MSAADPAMPGRFKLPDTRARNRRLPSRTVGRFRLPVKADRRGDPAVSKKSSQSRTSTTRCPLGESTKTRTLTSAALKLSVPNPESTLTLAWLMSFWKSNRSSHRSRQVAQTRRPTYFSTVTLRWTLGTTTRWPKTTSPNWTRSSATLMSGSKHRLANANGTWLRRFAVGSSPFAPLRTIPGRTTIASADPSSLPGIPCREGSAGCRRCSGTCGWRTP
jgi:hypothetical protein